MYPSTFIFAAIAAMAGFVAATPPACLLAAVLVQPNPADLKALCGDLEPQMASNITASCSGAPLSSAIAAYSSTCLAQGVTVSIPTSTPSSAATGASKPSATGAATTGSGAGAVTGTPTGTGAAPSGTGKSGASSISGQSGLLAILVSCGLASTYLL